MVSDGGWGHEEVRGGSSFSRRAKIVTLGLGMIVLGVACTPSGCGTVQGNFRLSSSSSEVAVITITSDGAAATTGTDALSSTMATDTVPPASTVPDPGPQTDIARVLAQLEQATAPTPIYGMKELPSGATVAANWWPVLFMAAPTEYQGPVVSNPMITGEEPAGKEVQLVLAMGGGWLMILENFRGDLGDATGSPVGQVAGHDATLYELNGGVLVQWSDDGAWYGVFGRGLPTADVVQVALSMTLVARGH